MKFTMSVLIGGMAVAMGTAHAGRVAIERPAIATHASSAVTPQQRASLAEKLALVEKIVRAAGADRAGVNVSAEHQRWMLQSLYQLPLADLRAMGLPGSYESTANAITKAHAGAAKRAFAKLGQPDEELVYTPITPCRFIDTRNVGGKIVTSRAYDLDLDGSLYGGSATCDPKSFVGGNSNVIGAISMNVAIVDPSFQPGFLGARPFGSTNTTSLVNWYESGPTVQASNAGVITTDQSIANDEIEFFGTSTHLVVDILGLFAAPTATPLECATGTLVAANVDTVTRNYNVTAGACPLNYVMVSNSCQALGDTASVRQGGGGVVNATTATCFGRYEGATAATITNTPWCCRLPGR